MAAAVAVDPSSSVKDEDLLSPSASPSPFPSPSSPPSPNSASPKMAANDAAKADLGPPPAAALARLPSPQAGLQPPSRRLPPPCWTQEETDALIQSYRQKWYALRRGNLRASHWEEVADAVARRCRHLYSPASGAANAPKTAVQCRHKMEKLRKRYRSEKRRPHRTSWVHFRDMDAMEMGTPAAAGAASRSKAAAVPDAYSDDGNEDDESGNEDEDDDDDDDGDDDDGDDDVEDVLKSAGTRSIDAVISKANGGVSQIGDLRFQIPKAVRSKVGTPRADDRVNTPNSAFNPKAYHASGSNGCFKGFSEGLTRKPPPSSVAEEMRRRMEDMRRREKEGAALGEMVAAVRMLGDGFMRVEEMKMEMAREMEKLRMEMELKRTEMILETQRWIVDAFVKGLAHGDKKKKKVKIGPES